MDLISVGRCFFPAALKREKTDKTCKGTIYLYHVNVTGKHLIHIFFKYFFVP